MAIGPGFARLPFRLIPGKASQQLPFPEMVQMPKLSSPVPPRPLAPRASEPVLDETVRRGRKGTVTLDEALEELRRENLDYRPRRIQDAPYADIDPITGREIKPTWVLLSPSARQTEMLIDAAESGSINEVFALVLNSVRNAKSPDELYPALVQLNALRKTYGRKEASRSGGRIVKGSAGEEGGTSGVRSFDVSGEATPGVIGDVIESAIDNEVWKAAYRVGIPKTQLGSWSEAFSALDIKGLGGRAEKTPLMKLAKKISNILDRKNETPEQIAKSLSDLEDITAPNGPMVTSGFNRRDIDYIASQVIDAQNRLNIDKAGLRLVSQHVGTSLPEDQLHSIFRSAMQTATNDEEVFAINALARDNFKSITFLDDIEDEGLQRIAAFIRAKNPDDPSSIGRIAARETPNERFARQFKMQRPPGPEVIKGDRIFGTFQNQGLFETLGLGPESSKSPVRFGRGGNFRSWEVYDEELKRPVHVVQGWNNNTKQWEEVHRNPIRSRRAFDGVPEYQWIGDPESGMAVKAPRVEYQNFFYRIAKPGESVDQPLPLIERLKESLELQRTRFGIAGDAKKVQGEVVNLVQDMVSKGTIAPNTPQFTWMHTVFGRIALNIQGPGVRVGSTGLVSRDANAGRRVASIRAFEEADNIGLVPAEAATYLRSLMPDPDAYRAARSAYKPKPAATKPKKTKAKSKPTGVIDEDTDATVASERAALNALIASLRS
jgi:hypothetical protein